MGAKQAVTIRKVNAAQIYDSRNNPTVAAWITLSDGKRAEFKVPSGASTGDKEAHELRDGGKPFRGKGVTQAVENVNRIIAPKVEGIVVGEVSQKEFDDRLNALDKSGNKSDLGANAILAVSGAYARALADTEGVQLYEHFGKGNIVMPVPQINVLNAGQHADTGFEVQETMILPVGAKSFAEAMKMGTDVWHALKAVITETTDQKPRLGDEGGFANPFRNMNETAEAVLAAIELAGYKTGKEIALGFDGAFSEIHGKDLRDKEFVPGDKTYHFGGKRLSSEEVVGFWQEVVRAYPVISIEDGMGERDTKGWKLLTPVLKGNVQLVLDDYVCTNSKLIEAAINDGIGNSSLIKLNQVGTVTETLEAMKLTRMHGRSNVISHRSGETEGDFIGHFAMHPLVTQIKSGSSRSDRFSKYNRLIIIEAQIGSAVYVGLNAFPVSVQEHWEAAHGRVR